MKIVKYPENKKANNPNKDAVFIYESGGRDIEHPFSGDSLEDLADETEGSWEVDLRNTSSRKDGGYPKADEDADKDYIVDVQEYPFYYSKKGSPRGKGYPREQDWWQKALSSAQSADILFLLKPSVEEIIDCEFQLRDQRRSQLWNLILNDEELAKQLESRLK